MTTKRRTDPFPFGTQPDPSLTPDYLPWCEDCDFQPGNVGNAVGLMAQHHGRTGHYCGVEVSRSVTWGREGRV